MFLSVNSKWLTVHYLSMLRLILYSKNNDIRKSYKYEVSYKQKETP